MGADVSVIPEALSQRFSSILNLLWEISQRSKQAGAAGMWSVHMLNVSRQSDYKNKKFMLSKG